MILWENITCYHGTIIKNCSYDTFVWFNWMSNENEKIVKEMSNNSTNVEDLFGDQPIMNQDLKSNSESTVLKRSVFTQP